jgi:predicted membrane-bound mannosyltransferase
MRIVTALPGAEEMLSRLLYRAALIRVRAMAAAILLTIAWMTPASA